MGALAGHEPVGTNLRNTRILKFGSGQEVCSGPCNDYPCHQNDYMQLFLFLGINSLKITFTITSCNL